MPEETEKKEKETKTPEVTEKADKTILIKHEFVLPDKATKKVETPKTPPVKPKTPPVTPPVKKEPPVEPPVKTPPVTPPVKKEPPVEPPKTDEVATLKGEKKALEDKLAKLEGNKKTAEIQTELDKTKKALQERTDQLALIAMKEFEVEKKALIDTAKKDWETKGLEKEDIDKKVKYLDETIDAPEVYEQVKRVMEILQPPTNAGGGAEVVEDPTKVPTGKATLPAVPKQYEGMKSVVDELYNILADPTKTKPEKDEADRRLDEMFSELIKGVRVGLAKGTFPTFKKTTCPACSELLEGEATSCEHCGWKLIVPRITRTR